MCLAVPARVEAIHEDDRATITLGGVRTSCSLALVEGVSVGDYVIVHTGFALSRLDAEEAQRTLDLLVQAGTLPPPGPMPAGDDTITPHVEG